MTVTMRTADAVPILRDAIGKPFRELFKGHPEDLITNKGHVGQLLELYVGLKNGSKNIDFADGELKTNKTKANGTPAETIAITQIASRIDQLLSDPPVEFEKSGLCEKLDNLLIVPVVKDGDCGSWYLLEAYNINMSTNPLLKQQMKLDYDLICGELRKLVCSGDNIHTTNARYLQIRSKDSKPYRPIYSEIFGRSVSNKNHAFYFRTSFINDLIKGSLPGMK